MWCNSNEPRVVINVKKHTLSFRMMTCDEDDVSAISFIIYNKNIDQIRAVPKGIFIIKYHKKVPERLMKMLCLKSKLTSSNIRP